MTYKIGEMVQDKGVFMGSGKVLSNWGIKDDFNVFVTPGDFQGNNLKNAELEFADAVTLVGSVEELHGNYGLPIASEEQLADAVKDGKYDGQWILPNFSVMQKIIHPNKDVGEFAGSYVKSAFNSFSGPEHYWVLRDDENLVEAANTYCIDTKRFLTQQVDQEIEASVRPIRLEVV